jgi:hypothetical protein
LTVVVAVVAGVAAVVAVGSVLVIAGSVVVIRGANKTRFIQLATLRSWKHFIEMQSGLSPGLEMSTIT